MTKQKHAVLLCAVICLHFCQGNKVLFLPEKAVKFLALMNCDSKPSGQPHDCARELELEGRNSGAIRR